MTTAESLFRSVVNVKFITNPVILIAENSLYCSSYSVVRQVICEKYSFVVLVELILKHSSKEIINEEFILPWGFCRDLLEDLSAHIKDAMEVKQEKVRRMKRRDYMRLRLIRIFELLADREVFQYW